MKNQKPRVGIIHASVREGRKGYGVTKWFAGFAKQEKGLAFSIIDLREENLPMMNEPNPSSQQKYTFDHTKKWSKKIKAFDAFVFVTAEYNHGYPAVLRNALEYLYYEWNEKPAAIISYGGIAGGSRAALKLKSDLAALEMIPLKATVVLPFFDKQIDEDGKFTPTPENEKAAQGLITSIIEHTK